MQNQYRYPYLWLLRGCGDPAGLLGTCDDSDLVVLPLHGVWLCVLCRGLAQRLLLLLLGQRGGSGSGSCNTANKFLKIVPRVADPGCLSRIRYFPSRIRIKEFKHFNPKNCFYALGNMIRVAHPGSGYWFFTHPESLIQGSKRHRIPDPEQCSKLCPVLQISRIPGFFIHSESRIPDPGSNNKNLLSYLYCNKNFIKL